MRLEPFCELTLRYTQASWHQPYGGEEGAGFGLGDGEVTGDVEGTLLWANAPRRREDGVWTPNLRGFITAHDGETLLVSIRGLSIEEQAPGPRRAILARVELTTETASYRWLNTAFLVGEGEIDEERGVASLRVFVCVNELAQGPPAVGVEPPERFRR
jgi:hypothetical protein